MAAKKKAAEKKAEEAAKKAATAAAKVSDKVIATTAKAHVYRTDMGESLPG